MKMEEKGRKKSIFVWPVSVTYTRASVAVQAGVCAGVPMSPCHPLTLAEHLHRGGTGHMWWVPGPPWPAAASSDATADALQCSDARQPAPGGGSYIYSRPGGNSFSWSLEAVLSCPVMRPLACILGDYHQWPWPRPRLTPVSPCDWHQLGVRGADYHLSSLTTKMNQDKCWCRLTRSLAPHAGSRVPRGSWHLQSI